MAVGDHSAAGAAGELAFVFQVCLKMAPPPDSGTDNYTIFLFCGFLPWLLFQETVTRSAVSLLENANLITKTVFPSEIVPLAIFLSSLMTHLMALALVLVAVAIWGGGISRDGVAAAVLYVAARFAGGRHRLDRCRACRSTFATPRRC